MVLSATLRILWSHYCPHRRNYHHCHKQWEQALPPWWLLQCGAIIVYFNFYFIFTAYVSLLPSILIFTAIFLKMKECYTSTGCFHLSWIEWQGSILCTSTILSNSHCNAHYRQTDNAGSCRHGVSKPELCSVLSSRDVNTRDTPPFCDRVLPWSTWILWKLIKFRNYNDVNGLSCMREGKLNTYPVIIF